MGISIPTLPIAKKYTKNTTEGMGAIKGAPCEIASIELGTQEGKQGYFITFEWEDNQQVRHQSEKFFPFGQKGDKGDKGDDGQSPTITVKSSTSTEYLLEIDANGTTIITPNLKGAKGADGEKGDKGDRGADGKTFTIKADYPDMASLIAAHPTGQAGDAYFVGNSDAPDLVVWEDEDNEWYNAGQIKGLKGDKGDKGDKGENGIDGITPQVTVNTQTQTEYTLKIKTGEQELITPNLRGKDGEGAVDEEMSTTSTNALMNKTTTNALNGKVDKVDGKGLSTNDYTTADKEKLAGINLNNYIPTSQKGANNGVAELDSSGKVPPSQLPSYVDDVLTFPTKNDFPAQGSDGIIYIAKDENASYRWDGSAYASIGGANGLTLGETSSTAYRGDRGKIAYDDSQANKNHIGDLAQLQTTTKTDLVSAINEAAQSGGSITVDDALDATSDNAVKNKVIKAAVDEKVDKVTGKGLSTNDFTNTYKTQLDNLNVDLTNKQDKTLAQSRSIEDANVTTVEGSIDALKTHTDRAVTDASGAHGFKVTNSNNETKILYKSGNAWVEIPLGDKTQVNTLPQASASTVGMILQYTGADTSTLTNGYWYKCEAQGTSPETYAWVNKPVMEVDDLMKDVLPTASADELGNIYMYTGATTSELQKGFFYECVRDGQNYEWLNIRVQAGGGQTIQYTVMPTASVETLGKVLQYTGATTSNYTHNHWYECKSKIESGSTVYYWDEQFYVKPIPVADVIELFS